MQLFHFRGGTHHVNEQYPSYWKRLFEAKGYRGSDILKRMLWDIKTANPLRKQNIMLYVKREKYEEVLSRFVIPDESVFTDAIHPEFWEERYKDLMERYSSVKKELSFQKRLAESLISGSVQKIEDVISEMNIFMLADNIKLIRSRQSWGVLEKRFGECEYVIWGNGEDANRIKELLDVLNMKSRFIFSGKKELRTSEKAQFIHNYNGEILIIGSRKYYSEIKKEIELDKNFFGVRVLAEQLN